MKTNPREPRNKKAALRRIRWSVLVLALWGLLVAGYVFLVKKLPFTMERGMQLGVSLLLPLLLYYIYVKRWQIRSSNFQSKEEDEE